MRADEGDADLVKVVFFKPIVDLRHLHVRKPHLELVLKDLEARLVRMGIQEDTFRVLGDGDDAAATVALQGSDQPTIIGVVLEPERTRKVRLETDQVRRDPRRNTIERMYEIEPP